MVGMVTTDSTPTDSLILLSLSQTISPNLKPFVNPPLFLLLLLSGIGLEALILLSFAYFLSNPPFRSLSFI